MQNMNYENSNIFSMQEYNLQKNPSPRNQNPSKLLELYYN